MTNLLADPVIQEARLTAHEAVQEHIVDVFFHAGVTDTLAESVVAGAQMLGITGLEHVETGRRYLLDTRLSAAEVRTIAEALLYNPVIQQYELRLANENGGAAHAAQCIASSDIDDTVTTIAGQGMHDNKSSPTGGAFGASPTVSIPICDMTGRQLLDLSKQGLLALNLAEMRTIQQHLRQQKREPTDVELETLAQTWSEHCSHKTFKATIVYRELDSHGNVLALETINGLLKQYLMRATQQVEQSWLVSAFSDNAGIIRFTGTQDIAFKVETHNHPSAIEPFGGANTGMGGVIRDVLGVSAQPIACTDILCFGPPDTSIDELPAGILAPRRIAGGVVNGVRDYGNKMGIPTVNGAVLYHHGYLYNPLVFCGCLGILPHGSHPRQVEPGDRIVVLGGRTGRDGIHGATFSSGEMSSEINAQAGSAVQIGAPITEKKVADVIIQARDRRLYHAITDCGAGGFSSAIGEMGAETGAYVELEKAPLKYRGLAPWEIWLSEAQERMVLAVPPAHLPALLEICEIEEVEASIIGTFTGSHRLVVTYQDKTVADLDMQFLHDGRPERTLESVWVRDDPGAARNTQFSAPSDPYSTSLDGATHWASTLLALLAHPTIASKEEVVRRYDHEVQGATVLKPLVGRAGNGPGDAAVLQPLLDEESLAGIVLTNGVNPLYGKIDPYHMAMNAVDEALRNLAAVGGDIEKAAILDNFCWGNPTDPLQLGMLVRAVKGCYDAALGFGTPFISGKDSLNNEYRAHDQRSPVIPTLVISAIGVIEDASRTIDMSLKRAGNLVYQVGATRNELAGSHYAEVFQPDITQHMPGTTVPQVDVASARATMKAVGEAIRKGLLQACHDLSEGGLAVAAAEMSLASLLGMTIDLKNLNVGAPLAGALGGAGAPMTRPIGSAWPSMLVGPGAPLADSLWKASMILLLSESPSRFLVEVAPEQREAFEAHMRSYSINDVACIGLVEAAERFIVRHGEETLIDLSIEALQQAWKGGQA
jgi:phosphoribosylformylglycinamidine synthase